MKTIKEFVEAYKAKRFMTTTKSGVDEKIEWLRNELGIKQYIPFKQKRQIAEIIVNQNIKEVDGIKRYDSIDGYISMIVASITAHTLLRFSEDPASDYDLLAESNILPEILALFADSHREIELLVNMALDMELKDNEINVMTGRFLNKISGMLDGVVDAVKDKFEDFDLEDVLGADFKPEDLTKLNGLLNRLK